MNEKEQKEALFKYKLIAPLLAGSKLRQKDYLLSLQGRTFEDSPFKQPSFSPKTVKKWLHKYRKSGFEGLMPSFRKDRGKSRKIPVDLFNEISNIVSQFEFRTVKNLYDYLIQLGMIKPDSFTYATLNNIVRQEGLLSPGRDRKPRKAFEVEHVNMLWVTDFMYGPYILSDRRKVQAFLCAIMDDHSRLIVSARFSDSMNTVAFEQVFKTALTLYGPPGKIYADNGKVFSQGHMELLAARLGFIIVHSKPYDAPSRGKIERFFRTVRDSFIPNFHIKFKGQSPSLDQLNGEFSGWLHDKYNHKVHSTTAMTPYDRYFADLPKTAVRKLSDKELASAFLHVIYRKVNNDSTVRINNVLFELPSRYIGKSVEIRFNLEKPSVFFLYDGGVQVQKLDRLDKHLNANFPIKFNDPFESDSDLFV